MMAKGLETLAECADRIEAACLFFGSENCLPSVARDLRNNQFPIYALGVLRIELDRLIDATKALDGIIATAQGRVA